MEQGDRMCLHLVEDCAEQAGIAIANAVNLLNPQLVVLYGFMLELGEHFLRPLEQAIRKHTVPLAEDFRICLSGSLEDLLPWGAVAELFAEFMNRENYRWVYRLTPGDLEQKEC
jgi:predicted NBD/HSP70 family sugar kinase